MREVFENGHVSIFAASANITSTRYMQPLGYHVAYNKLTFQLVRSQSLLSDTPVFGYPSRLAPRSYTSLHSVHASLPRLTSFRHVCCTSHENAKCAGHIEKRVHEFSWKFNGSFANSLLLDMKCFHVVLTPPPPPPSTNIIVTVPIGQSGLKNILQLNQVKL